MSDYIIYVIPRVRTCHTPGQISDYDTRNECQVIWGCPSILVLASWDGVGITRSKMGNSWPLLLHWILSESKGGSMTERLAWRVLLQDLNVVLPHPEIMKNVTVGASVLESRSEEEEGSVRRRRFVRVSSVGWALRMTRCKMQGITCHTWHVSGTLGMPSRIGNPSRKEASGRVVHRIGFANTYSTNLGLGHSGTFYGMLGQ